MSGIIETPGEGGTPTAASIATALSNDTSNVSSSSGGRGATDAALPAKFNAFGGMRFGSNTAANGNTSIVDIRGAGDGFTLYVQNGGGGFAVEALPSANTQGGAYSTHLIGNQPQVGMQIDGISYTGTQANGIIVWLNASAGPCFVAADGDLNERFSIFADGTIRFTQSSWGEANRISVSADAATAARAQAHPDVSGKIAVLPIFANSTAANAAVSVGDVWWDSTLKKARTRMS